MMCALVGRVVQNVGHKMQHCATLNAVVFSQRINKLFRLYFIQIVFHSALSRQQSIIVCPWYYHLPCRYFWNRVYVKYKNCMDCFRFNLFDFHTILTQFINYNPFNSALIYPVNIFFITA